MYELTLLLNSCICRTLCEAYFVTSFRRTVIAKVWTTTSRRCGNLDWPLWPRSRPKETAMMVDKRVLARIASIRTVCRPCF